MSLRCCSDRRAGDRRTDGTFSSRAAPICGSLARQTRQWFEAEPLWFKRAVFYEIHIRGFFDANGDGSGDFRGLTEKLDYLQWLGIDCIWLLPFYQSPLRDGGYDISDFRVVHPDYGTVEDVRKLIDAAHARRIRVIADLVMNHTSIDHAWFQESRSSADSPKRDWYVWSDTDDRYQDARIIFTDTETSNWTWDPVAGAVLLAPVLLQPARPQLRQPGSAARRWSTSCASGSSWGSTASGSTPFRTVRARRHDLREPARDTRLSQASPRGDRRALPDRVLLAEANQWPEDVVEYFGAGDECQMAFHFPVMPRMFMAVRASRRPRSTRSSSARRRSPTAANGACSCATTTS